MVFGIALAVSEPVLSLFSRKEPKPVVHVLEEVPCPPCSYIKIDEKVWILQLL